MAALLRQGARRIGGSVLQRTQVAVTSPAVAEERRRLVPRRMYSNKEQATEELTRKIQQRLYDVKPRPEDSKWHHPGRSKWASNVVDIAGLVAFIGMAASVFYFGRLLGDSKDVQAMMMKEMREEKEAEIREVMKKRRSGLIKTSS